MGHSLSNYFTTYGAKLAAFRSANVAYFLLTLIARNGDFFSVSAPTSAKDAPCYNRILGHLLLYYIRVVGSNTTTSLAKMNLLLVINLNAWLANYAMYKFGNQLRPEVFP